MKIISKKEGKELSDMIRQGYGASFKQQSLALNKSEGFMRNVRAGRARMTVEMRDALLSKWPRIDAIYSRDDEVHLLKDEIENLKVELRITNQRVEDFLSLLQSALSLSDKDKKQIIESQP